MQIFWTTLAAHLRAGARVFVALVGAHELHSPGTAGARLLVPQQGEPFGSIGGGVMEFNVLQRARAVLAEDTTPPPTLQVLDHRGRGLGEPSGLVCAGGQTNLYLSFLPNRDLAVVEEIVALLERDRPGILHITPAGLRVVPGPLDLGAPPISLLADGATWRYEEQLLNRRRVAILGIGHCARALARQMHWLGFGVEVFSTRAGRETAPHGSPKAPILIEDFAEAGAKIPFQEVTDVVLMTSQFEDDVRGLLGVLPFPFPYIGLMGSAAKIGRVFSVLQKQGISRERLARVTAPVGLPIESDTPEEIAVSVAAQIIRRRKLAALPVPAGEVHT